MDASANEGVALNADVALDELLVGGGVPHSASEGSGTEGLPHMESMIHREAATYGAVLGVLRGGISSR